MVLVFGMVVGNHGYEGMALDYGMDTKTTGSFHGNGMVMSQPRTGSQMVDLSRVSVIQIQ